MNIPGETGRHTVLGAALAAAALLAAILVVNGCTSDPENLVGTPLVEATFDTVLVPLAVDDITDYSAFKVTNDDIPVFRQELVYMGEQGGTSSSIIANFDFTFTTLPRDTVAFPDSIFTLDNIKTVDFSLVKPIHYQSTIDIPDGEATRDSLTGQPVDLYYLVRELEAPFIEIKFGDDYPHEVPPHKGTILNQDFAEANNFDEPFLDMYPEDFIRWFEAAGRVGLMIQFDTPSDPGLVGYASREVTSFSQFSDLQVGTVVGPNLRIEFNEFPGEIGVFLMGSTADASTFDVVPEAPASLADGIMLRTGLRSYPALMFDFSTLPENARINRAVIELHNDTGTSFGVFADLWVSELDSTEFQSPGRTIELDQFKEPDWVYPLSGENGVVPTTDEVVELEVTVGVQRYVNRVNEEPKGLFLTAGEIMIVDLVPLFRYGTGLTPDFYYRQFNFHGTSAAPEMRPRLKITYSLIDELGGGGN